MPSEETTAEYTMQQQQQQQSFSSGPPAIQPAPSGGSASLAYSIETDAMMDRYSNNGISQRAREEQQLPPRIRPAPTSESLDYSIYSSGEMDAEQYYAHTHSQYNQYQEQAVNPQQQEQQQQQPTVNEYQNQGVADATPTVHGMHRKLLYLLTHPELFSEAMDWQAKVDRGLDPSRPGNNNDEEAGNGITSFDNEFTEDQSLATTAAADEHKDDVVTEDGNNNNRNSNGNINDDQTTDTASSKFKDQEKLIPPLPLQIFASDAEVVLPQALTASQLFGIERVTGIELEAAAGTIGLSQLFLRWLALMPEGDHMNVIDPPGLTVMRISGGRYRVTGAHRVVWRWMNKFSPASMFTIPSDFKPAETSGMEEDDAPDTDFDFGDLVSMTIIDVFETDADGKLLSYCPTFDNRAVHKTQEVTERLRKGASHFKERMEVVARSPAGKSVNKTAGNFGRMSISAALAVGNIVKNKIEEGIHKHQHPKQGGGGLGRENDISEEESYTDAVGGDDVEEEALLRGDEHSTATPGGGGASKSAASKGEGYFSDESTPSRQMEV